MKQIRIAAVLVFSALAAWAGEIVNSKNLFVDREGIRPFHQLKPFFETDFGKDPSQWDPALKKSYRDLIKIDEKGTKFGQQCLLVTRNIKNKQTDTAWCVGTKAFPFTGKPGLVEIAMEIAGNVELNGVLPQGYRNDIEWLDAKGKPIAVTPLNYPGNNRGFSVSHCTGTVPAGTKSFIIRLGFDTPNILADSFCAIKSLKIANIEEAPYEKIYSFETRPFENSGKTGISWKADTPAGTSVTAAVSTAEDQDGLPGVWSTFGKENSKPFFVTAPWVRFRITFRTSGKAYPVLKEFNMGKRRETIWYARVPAAPLVENKTISPTRNAKTDVVLRVVSTVPVKWKTLKVSVDGKDVSGKLIRKGDIVTCKAEQAYAPGKHTVKGSVSSEAGSTEFTKYFLIGDSPAVPKITIRDDGMTLIDGKPFFPIGFYGVWKKDFNNNDFDKCMKDIHEAGVNLVHTYKNVNTPDGDRYFAAGRKYGIKFMMGARHPEDKSLVKHLKNPDILAWYIGDDTSRHTTPAKLQDLNDHFRAIDDKRITTQAEGVWAVKGVSCYRDFVLGSDSFLPEIYPLHKRAEKDSCVAMVIRDMKVSQYDISLSRTDRPRSVWAVIQYFQGWTSWKFPKENELRAMSFASIIHGATGILWYTYGGGYDPKTKKTNYGLNASPEQWRIITTLTKQLNQLIPVLTERSPKDQPAVAVLSGPEKDLYGHPSVTCLLKKHNGKSYLFAVNSTNTNVKAKFLLPGLGKGKVLFENRSCEVKDGGLTDEFKPYDVHIYEL